MMKAGSPEYKTLLKIVKKDPKITSAEAIKRLHCELRTEGTGVEILGLRTIAARYLNNLGFFGGI